MNDFLAKLLLEKEGDKRFRSAEERKKNGGRKEIFDFSPPESDKFKRDAMSQFQEDKIHHKRSGNYKDLNQWDYLNQQELPNATSQSRRSHFSYGNTSQPHSVTWNPLGMGLPRQTNPYYSNPPHGPVMPAHAHSIGRYNQWNNPGQKGLPNMNNAHSQNSVLSQSRMDIKHRSDISNSGFVLPVGHSPDFSKIRSNPREMLRGQFADKSTRSSMHHPDLHAPVTSALKNSGGRPSPLSAPTKTVISNPLSDLQMLVKNQEKEKTCQKSDSYQHESVDLSAHHSDPSKTRDNPAGKRGEKLPIENNHSDKRELRPSVSVIKVQQQNKMFNRVDDLDDIIVEDENNEKPVELTSKSGEKLIQNEIPSSADASVKTEEGSEISEPGKIETSGNENITDETAKIENLKTENIKAEKCENSNVNCGEGEESKQSETKPENLVENGVENSATKHEETGATEEANNPGIESDRKDDAEGQSNKRKPTSEQQQQPEIDGSKMPRLEDESKSENEEGPKSGTGGPEEISDLPTVSSTSAEVRPSPGESVKKTTKKKPNRKSRPFHLSPGQSSSSESHLCNKKFRTHSGKDDSKKKGKKGLCDSVDRRGPFLHVEGSKESPTTVTVINFPKGDDEDEKDKSSGKKQTLNLSRTKHRNELDYRGKSKKSLYSSTLSSRYDAHTTDHTWVCVFCKKGPHYNALGDLFGPYIISEEENISGASCCDFSGDEKDISDAQKRGGRNKRSLRASNMVEHFQKMSKKLRRSQSSDSSLVGMTVISDDETDQVRYEVWVHEQCAVWSPNVCLIGSRLVGMQEAIWSSVRTMCSKCGVFGANIGCVFRNCPNRSHYHCAKENEWSLEQATFISTCQIHKSRS